MHRPNLFLVGAMKSGTTSLHSYLAGHPSIYMVPMKEPTHFVDGEELRSVSPALWEAGIWRDQKRYLEMFADAGNEPIIGESSTNYAKQPQITGVAERLKAFNPDSRIVYIMRDPIERTISHYWHMARWHDESRDILQAVVQEKSYRQVSHYAMQLAPYIECFGADRVKTVTLEELKADPVRGMNELFNWLGVDPSYSQSIATAAKNVSVQEVTKVRGFGILHQIRYSRWWESVSQLVPKSIRTLGSQLAERRMVRGSIDTQSVVEHLRPLQQAETTELIQLLGREFPEWRTLYETQENV